MRNRQTHLYVLQNGKIYSLSACLTSARPHITFIREQLEFGQHQFRESQRWYLFLPLSCPVEDPSLSAAHISCRDDNLSPHCLSTRDERRGNRSGVRAPAAGEQESGPLGNDNFPLFHQGHYDNHNKKRGVHRQHNWPVLAVGVNIASRQQKLADQEVHSYQEERCQQARPCTDERQKESEKAETKSEKRFRHFLPPCHILQAPDVQLKLRSPAACARQNSHPFLLFKLLIDPFSQKNFQK
jgi:hypothetical protein